MKPHSGIVLKAPPVGRPTSLVIQAKKFKTASYIAALSAVGYRFCHTFTMLTQLAARPIHLVIGFCKVHLPSYVRTVKSFKKS